MDPSDDVVMRFLNRSDAAEFRRLRLSALQESPTAFGSSYELEADLPIADVEDRIEADPEWSWVLGAFTQAEKLVGTVGFRRGRSEKLAHKALLWGIYVAPEHRGHGLARHLMLDCIERARAIGGLRHIKLLVNVEQEAAVDLYESLGFERFGTERDAFHVGGRYYDEAYMALRLR